MGAFDVLTAMLIVHMFFSFGITTLIYALPEADREELTTFSLGNAAFDSAKVQDEFDSTIGRQTNLSVIDVAALALYSGNIFVDIFINFIYAVPAMSALVLTAFFTLVPVNPQLALSMKMFFGVLIFIGMLLSVLRFLTSGRTPGGTIA